MIAFKKSSDGNFKSFTSFILAAIVCVLLILPAKAEAAWGDTDISDIIKNVEDVKTQLQTLFDQIKNARATVGDGKVQNLLVDMKAMLQQAVNAQQAGLSEFMAGGSCVANDGTPCSFFRADLLFVMQSLEDINNQLLSMHNIPSLNIQLEDPGLADLLNKIPGPILFPLYKVITKTKLLDPGFLGALADLPIHLENVKLVLFPALSASPTSLSMLTVVPRFSTAITIPTASRGCPLIGAHPQAFNITSTALNATGSILEIIGAIMKAMGKTAITGLKEVDAGVHGYVHGTLATDHVGALGEITSIVGKIISELGKAITGKISSCGTELRQIEIMRGQKEILCAMKNNNLSPYCDEFVGNGFDSHGVGGGKP